MGTNQKSWGTSDGLTVKLHDAESAKVYRRAGQLEFFKSNGLLSAGQDKPIVSEDAFKKAKGDRVTKAFVRKPSNDGLTEDQVNLDKASGITSYSQNTTLDRRVEMIAVPAPSTLSVQRIQMNLPYEAREYLAAWMADFKDRKIFDALSTSPTDVYYYASGTFTHTATLATATAAITATDLFEPEMLDAASIMLKDRRVPHINVGGKKMYIAILSNEQLFDLRRNSEWTQAQREAQMRGASNPIFSGAEAIWNNTLVFSHDGIKKYSTGGAGANVNYSQALVMGAQAALWADGSPQPIEIIPNNAKANEEIVFKASVMYGVTKAQFNSEDLSLVTLVTAHTANLNFASALKENG